MTVVGVGIGGAIPNACVYLRMARPEVITTEEGAVVAGAAAGKLTDEMFLSKASGDSSPWMSNILVDSAGLSAGPSGAMAPIPMCEAIGCELRSPDVANAFMRFSTAEMRGRLVITMYSRLTSRADTESASDMRASADGGDMLTSDQTQQT